MYQLDIKSGEVSVVPGILSQYIHGVAISGRDILFSTSVKDGVKEAKIFRLKPEQGNTVEEIVPEGNPRVFALPNYHKATNQMILVSKSGLYKMDMATKKIERFYKLGDNRRLMFYDIAQKEERLYFYEAGARYILAIDFRGNEICRIPLP